MCGGASGLGIRINEGCPDFSIGGSAFVGRCHGCGWLTWQPCRVIYLTAAVVSASSAGKRCVTPNSADRLGSPLRRLRWHREPRLVHDAACAAL